MRFGKVYAMAVVPPCDEIRRRSSPPCLRLPRRRNHRPGRRAPRGGFHYTDIEPSHSRRLPCGRVSGASTEGREGSPWCGQPFSVPLNFPTTHPLGSRLDGRSSRQLNHGVYVAPGRSPAGGCFSFRPRRDGLMVTPVRPPLQERWIDLDSDL